MDIFQEDIERCLEILHSGGIILYPTDTIWGIGCDATNAAAVEKIIALKQRPADKNFVVLVSSEREVMRYAASVDLAVFDYLAQAQKPTTVIYEGAIGLADNVVGADGSAAMRITNDEFCKHLVKRFQKPLVSTSANTSGNPSPGIFPQIEETIILGVDYVVKHRQDDNSPTTPSAIIRWGKNGEPIIIRP